MTDPQTAPPRWLALALIGLACFCTAPFVALCAFAHPSADDWYMAAAGRDSGVIQASIDWYYGLTGRYTQQTVTSLHPIRLGIVAYQVWCVLMIVVLLASMFACIKRWLPALSPRWWVVLTASAASLFFWQLPSPAQGIYWVNGLNTYLLAAIFQMLLAAVLGPDCMKPGRPQGVVKTMAAVVLAVLAVGCSEVAMGFQALILAVLVTASLALHKTVSRILAITFLTTIVACVVVIKAPGNDWRMALYDNDVHGRLVPSLILAAKLSVVRGVSWLSSAPFLLFTALLLGFWQAPLTDRRTSWIILATGVLLTIGTVWGGFFIGAWSSGSSLPPRAVNLIYTFLVLDWVLLVHAAAVWLKAHDFPPPRLNAPALALVLAALAFSLGSRNTVKTAWRDLVKGDAVRFHKENMKRYNLMLRSQDDVVAVPPLVTLPKSLFFNDFKADPQDWRNAGAARFFKKKEIQLQQP